MSIKRNLIYNFCTNAWTSVISIVFIPLYIRFIGIEAYGLLGIYSILQSIASLFDLGITQTMNREMARFSVLEGKLKEIRNLVRTLEIIYWIVAILIGMTVIVLVPFFTQYWIKTVNLSNTTIQNSLFLIGIILVFQWPFTFYAGGLMGLQKQSILGMVNAGLMTLRGIGAILILWLISPTVQAFLLWQIIVSIMSILVVRLLLWHNLPSTGVSATFQIAELKKVWRFAAGISAISILGLILFQTDKVILSKLISLEKFGYYVLAGAVSASLYLFVNPVYNAIFPKFTQLVENNDNEGLIIYYHLSSEVMSVVLIPAVVVLALYSREILFVWTGNVNIVSNTYILLSLLVIGTGLQGLAHIPWAIQLAHGWTRLGFYVNLFAVITLVPLCIFLSYRYGAVGAATAWVIINATSIFFSQIIMHSRLLEGELLRWYVIDVGRTTIVTLTIAGICRLLIHSDMSRILLLITLIIISSCTMAAAVSASPYIRGWVLGLLFKRNINVGNVN